MPYFSPKNSSFGFVDRLRSSTTRPKIRDGSGTQLWGIQAKFGVAERPLRTVTSWVSQSGLRVGASCRTGCRPADR